MSYREIYEKNRHKACYNKVASGEEKEEVVNEEEEEDGGWGREGAQYHRKVRTSRGNYATRQMF